MENLKISYKSNANFLMVGIEGSLTLMDALELKKVLPDKAKNYSRVRIDLNKVSSLDLTGFNVLLMTKKKMKGNTLEVVANENHPFHQLAYLTKFSDQFVIISNA